MFSSPKMFPFSSIILELMGGQGAEGVDGKAKRRDCRSQGQECSVARHVSRLWVEDGLSCGIKANRALGNETSSWNVSLLKTSSLNYFREAVSKDWEFCAWRNKHSMALLSYIFRQARFGMEKASINTAGRRNWFLLPANLVLFPR